MSTKIYSGYKIVGVRGLRGLRDWWSALSPKLTAKQTELAESRVAAQALDYFDCDMLGLPRSRDDGKFNPAYAADCQVRNEIKLNRGEGTRHPDTDFEFTLGIYPVGQTILALLTTEQAELTKTFESDSHVVHFPYWNNSDRPKDVTARQWGERKLLWDAALDDRSFNGLELALGEPLYLVTFNPARIPQTPIDKRALKYARQTLLNRHFKKHFNPKKSCIGTVLREADEWIDGLGRPELQSLAAVYAAKLKHPVTEEDLRADPPEPKKRGK